MNLTKPKKNFGQIPYVFCYVDADNYVEFFVINRQRHLLPLHLIRYNVTNVENRVEILKMVLNIAWCLRDYENMQNS